MTIFYTVTGGVVALAAAMLAVKQMLQWARSLARTLERLDTMLKSELEPDDHATIKQDIHAMALAIGILQRQVQSLALYLHNRRDT